MTIEVNKESNGNYEILNLPITLRGLTDTLNKFSMTRENALCLFDKLERVIWDEETYQDLEERIDQLEYELEIARDELTEIHDNGLYGAREMYEVDRDY